MGIIQRAKTAFAVMTQKELGNSLGTVLRNFTPEGNYNPRKNFRGITFKALDKIATSAQDYEPQILGRDGKSVKNHPLLSNLLKKPNPRQSMADFIYLFVMHRYIYGEVFIYLARGERSKKVKEMYLLNPSAMELVVHDGELVGYVLQKSNGTQVPFEPEEIYHDKKPNPFNEWRGLSVLEMAALYTDTEIITSRFTLNYIKNSASPSGIVSLPSMNQETFKQFAAQWREGYEGPENAGKTAFVRGDGVDFKAVGATLQDIDQKVTREMAKEDVLMMLEVPKALLGKTDEAGLGRANIEIIYYVFSKEVVDNLHERLDEIFNNIAQTSGLIEAGRVIEHISTVQQDKEYLLEKQKAGVNRWITINEVRAMDGLEPIPDGDKLVTQNVMPITQEKKKVVFKKNMSKHELELKKASDNEQMRQKVVDISEVYTRKIKSEISKLAQEQQTTVVNAIDASSKSYDDWLFNIKEETEKFAASVLPIVIELMEAQTENVANFITGELITVTEELKQIVSTRILQIAGAYNKDTLTALEATLTDGAANGESLAKLKGRVEDVFQEAKGYRAERIARTESLRASNLSAELTYKQSGFSKAKWFTNPGACEFCQTFDGQVKEIGSDFAKVGTVVESEAGNQMSLTYDDVVVPPLHPQCRCSIVPE